MPQISQQEQEEFEFRARMEREQGMQPTAPPANGAEELRAKRVRSASPQELRKIHFGENVPAGARAEQVSPITDFAEGLGVQLPAGMISGVGDLAKSVYETAGKPVEQAKLLGQVAKGVVTQPFEDIEKLSTGTPKEMGKATGSLLAQAIPTAKVGGAAAEIGMKVAKEGAASGARRLVSSVVKPSLKEQAFTKDPTGAILKHRVIGNSEKSMLGNVEGVVTKLNDDVGKNIAKSSAQVSPAEINGVLENTITRVASQVGETNSTGIIGKLRQIQEQVMNRYGDRNLDLPEVHALRREIDDGISFTEDAVEKGVNKGKYEFRTGLNDIIERHVPGVRATNMDIASLLSAKEALTRRVNIGQNANFFTPLTVAGEAATTLAGAPGAYLGTKLGARVLGSTAVKSRAAQALESMSGKRQPVTQIEPPPPAPQLQLPYRTGPDTSGVSPMSQQGVGAQFEAVSQGMGQPGRPGQLALPPANITENALAPIPAMGVGRKGQVYPQSQHALFESNPGGQFQQVEGGYRFRDPSQMLDPDILQQQRMQSVQGGIESSERNWQKQMTLPPELENMTLGQYMKLIDLNPQAADFIDTFIRTTK